MTQLRHGQHATKTYRAWQQAKKRCRNPRDKDFPSYGGRGLIFSEQWDDFIVFFRDMGHCPEGFTLGRKDNNLGYAKENCRWESLTSQARNKRNTLWLTAGGVTKCIADWVDETGLKRVTIRKRLEAGWSHERAVTTQLQGKGPSPK